MNTSTSKMNTDVSKLIRIQLLKNGVTQMEVAREAGVHHSLVWMVLEGRTSSPRVVHALIKAGISPALIRRISKRCREIVQESEGIDSTDVHDMDGARSCCC